VTKKKKLEDVARAFLAALDERRWHDAAALVDPQTLERFRTVMIKILDLQARQPAPPAESDTYFIPLTTQLGVADAAAAERSSATQLLAHLAESSHPDNVFGHHGMGQPEGIRIVRTLVGVEPTSSDRATAHYRIEWSHGNPYDNEGAGVHALELAHTPGGWRIRDADLSGYGGGHILPPEEFVSALDSTLLP
jgi:hypothetical protein